MILQPTIERCQSLVQDQVFDDRMRIVLVFEWSEGVLTLRMKMAAVDEAWRGWWTGGC